MPEETVYDKFQLPEGLKWVHSSEAVESEGVVTGTDEDGSVLLVSRVRKGKEIGTASLVPEACEAKIGYFGKMHVSKDYELLMSNGPNVRWETALNGDVPDGAIKVGHDGQDRMILLARVRIGEIVVAAKMISNFHGAFAGWNGLEYFRRKYDVLCVCEDEEKANLQEVKESDEIELTDNHKGELIDDRKEGIHLPEGLLWRYAEDGQTFENAVTSGTDKQGRELHVIRGSEKFELASGVLRVGEACASVPYYKIGAKHDTYEVLVNESGIPLKWVSAENGDVPDNAIQSGVDRHGQPIWIARSNLCDVWTPGKLVSSTRRAYVAQDGIEYTRIKYEVLCVAEKDEDIEDNHEETEEEMEDERIAEIPVIDGIEWIDCKDGEIPPYAVVIDGEGDKRQYVARISQKNELTTGGVRSGEPAVVPHYGIAEDNERYQVLTVTNTNDISLYWVPSCEGVVHECAFQAGLANDGDKIYPARGKSDDFEHYAPGKIRERFKTPYFAHEKEITLPTYDILCIGEQASSLEGAVPALINGIDKSKAEEPDERKQKVPSINGLEWVNYSGDGVPSGAVILDGEGEEVQYVARISEEFELLAGGVFKGKPAVGPYFGASKEHTECEILVCKMDTVKLFWAPDSSGKAPDCAIHVGIAGDRDRIFAARAKLGECENYSAGKLREGYWSGFFSYNGKEMGHKQYEVLCIGDDAEMPECAIPITVSS